MVPFLHPARVTEDGEAARGVDPVDDLLPVGVRLDPEAGADVEEVRTVAADLVSRYEHHPVRVEARGGAEHVVVAQAQKIVSQAGVGGDHLLRVPASVGARRVHVKVPLHPHRVTVEDR